MPNDTPADKDNEEIIEISAEDLDTEPLPEAPDESVNDVLVIDLDDLPDEPPQPIAAAGAQLPTVGELPAGWHAAKKPAAGGLLSSAVLQMALAGLVGGLLAWAVQEPFISDTDPRAESPAAVLLAMAGFGAVLGGLIGLALGSVEGIVSGVWEKAALGGGLGLVIGGTGGALGGLLGQVVYGTLGGGGLNIILQIAVRGFAWGVVGVFVGLGQGVMMRAPQKILNGLIGGAVGGFASGFLFDPISLVFGGITLALGGEASGWLSRMVGMSVMGLCAGAAIGMVEQIRKEAWLTIVAGPMTGKQFIIYVSPTIIGSSPKADICLLKDPHVAPEHAQIEREASRYVLTDLGQGQTAVNQRPVARCQLRDGDYVMLGQTVLQYATRAVDELPR